MTYDANIMSAARRAFEADRDRREQSAAQRRQEVYDRLPRVEEIDREMRATVGKLMIAAFESGADTESSLRELERRNLALQRERAELLVGAGFSYDTLDDAPHCPHCGDSGTLSDGSACRCLMTYYTAEQNRRLSKMLDLGGQSFDTFSLDWYDDGQGATLRHMELVLEACINYARRFGERSGNLMFTGAPGLGKTFLSACIAREVSERGYSVVYDTAGHIFQQFESDKFGRENPYEEAADREVNRYLNCDLLIMDDLGTEMLTGFVQSAFYRIINDRLLGRRKTVLSTNLTPAELSARYGAAVSSRIQGEYDILQFYGKDIRLQKKNR